MDTFNKDQEKEVVNFLHSEEFTQFFVEKEAPESMDKKFHKMLSERRPVAKKRRSWSFFLRLAVPMMAILVAFFIGRGMTAEDQVLAQEDFTSELLGSDNVGDKINLVSNTNIKDETDDKVIDALLFSLSNDESVNVRLACINTLYDYAYRPKVRTGLIQAVSNQESPVVLANLAEAINASGKKLSKEEFMDLINKDLPPPIKNSIDASLIKI